MVSVFGSVCVVNYIYRFACVELDLRPRDEANLIMMDKLLDVLLDSVCQYCIGDLYPSVFIMDIDLKFSVLVVSLTSFGIRMMVS